MVARAASHSTPSTDAGSCTPAGEGPASRRSLSFIGCPPPSLSTRTSTDFISGKPLTGSGRSSCVIRFTLACAQPCVICRLPGRISLGATTFTGTSTAPTREVMRTRSPSATPSAAASSGCISTSGPGIAVRKRGMLRKRLWMYSSLRAPVISTKGYAGSGDAT